MNNDQGPMTNDQVMPKENLTVHLANLDPEEVKIIRDFIDLFTDPGMEKTLRELRAGRAIVAIDAGQVDVYAVRREVKHSPPACAIQVMSMIPLTALQNAGALARN